MTLDEFRQQQLEQKRAIQALIAPNAVINHDAFITPATKATTPAPVVQQDEAPQKE